MKSPLAIAAILLIACILIGLLLGQPTSAQSTAATGNRFQLIVAPATDNKSLYLLDTTSGETLWRDHLSQQTWRKLGSPVISEAK